VIQRKTVAIDCHGQEQSYRDRAGEGNRLRDRDRYSYGGKGKSILKLRSIEMAIKLVARPRHGQYEHNKSPLTQCEAVNGQWPTTTTIC